ncbi:MAG TPA: tRNA nucleotidyltransferase [Candidatus Magasanikbacteria bacterium]|nr:tRNA nucleotidyltransferase [Candidatus Magasanikbacteria bacterium]
MKIEQLLKKIHALSAKAKTPVYPVGGFVRDYILAGNALPETKDIDFVVLGSGVAFARTAIDTLKGEDFVAFEEFDTARFRIDDIVIECAGARSENYQEASRKPHVTAVATLEEDLKRRDFTINAMALELTAKGVGAIIDPRGGQKDLTRRIIRTPLAPEETFSDDPLRIIRACRFAGRFNFAIEEHTKTAITKNIERLSVVSWERIKEELDKMLTHEKPSSALIQLYAMSVLEYIAPELTALDGVEYVGDKGHKNQFTHTLQVLDQMIPLSDKLNLRWAAFLHDIGKAPTKRFDKKLGWTFHAHDFVGQKMFGVMGRRLRFDTHSIKYIQKLIRWHLRPIALCDEGISDSAVRRLIVNMGDDLEDLLKLYRADITTKNPRKLAQRAEDYERLLERIEEVRETDRLRAFQSPVRGEEIMQLCGLKPGKDVGTFKTAIEEAILEGIIPNEYEAAKAYLLKIKGSILK